MTKEFFHSQKLLLGMLVVMMGVLLLPVILFGPNKSSLVLNQFHALWADDFFKWVTHFGEFMFIAPVVLILYIVRRRALALAVTCNSLLALVLTYGLKHYIFPHTKRPFGLYGQMASLHLVDGVQVHSCNTFPSGHTMAAFAVFMFLAFNVKGWAKYVCFLIAVGVGVSRIYLFQHFALDVIIGAMLGSLIAFFAHSVIMVDGSPVSFRLRLKKRVKKTEEEWAPCRELKK